MHILIIPSWYPETSSDIGGCFFREQAIALKKYGYNVGVISPQFHSMRQWKAIATHSYGYDFKIDTGIPTFRYHFLKLIPKIPRVYSWLWLRVGLKLFKKYIIQYGKPDLIHVHSLIDGGLLALILNEKYNIPYIITEHSTAFERGLIKAEKKKNILQAAKKASKLIAVSESFSEYLTRYFNNEINWKCIYNMLPKQFEEMQLSKKTRLNNTFVFCSIAFFSEIKRIDLLLLSFAKSFAGNLSVRLSIAGDGPKRKQLEDLSKQLGVDKQVTFHGIVARNNALKLMAESHCYVLTSDVETFGVVIIESLALGNPVIATKAIGPKSIVRKEDGYLVEKNSVDGLAKAMKEMKGNYHLFNSIEIKKSCVARFSEKNITQQLTDIYLKVLEK